MVSVLFGFLVINSPKHSSYDTIKGAHDTHHIAISNRRILGIADGKVTFTYKDRRNNDQEKMLTLDAGEFVRRFLLHVLPARFHKIRHFVLLAIRNRKTKLLAAQLQLAPAPKDLGHSAGMVESGSLKQNLVALSAAPIPGSRWRFCRPMCSGPIGYVQPQEPRPSRSSPTHAAKKPQRLLTESQRQAAVLTQHTQP